MSPTPIHDILEPTPIPFSPSITSLLVLTVFCLGLYLLTRLARRKNRLPAKNITPQAIQDTIKEIKNGLEKGQTNRRTLDHSIRTVKRLLSVTEDLDYTAYSGTELAARAQSSDSQSLKTVLDSIAALDDARYAENATTLANIEVMITALENHFASERTS